MDRETDKADGRIDRQTDRQTCGHWCLFVSFRFANSSIAGDEDMLTMCLTSQDV